MFMLATIRYFVCLDGIAIKLLNSNFKLDLVIMPSIKKKLNKESFSN